MDTDIDVKDADGPTGADDPPAVQLRRKPAPLKLPHSPAPSLTAFTFSSPTPTGNLPPETPSDLLPEASFLSPKLSDVYSPTVWIDGRVKFQDESGKSAKYSDKNRFLLIPGEELASRGDQSQFSRIRDFLLHQPAEENDGASVTLRDCGDPKLLVNIIGDVKLSTIHDQRLKSAIKCLLRMTENTWLFTDGYCTSFNDVVASAVTEVAAECNQVVNAECNVSVTCVGFCQWNRIIGRENIEAGLSYAYRKEDQNLERREMVLESHHTHFVGVTGDAFKASRLRHALFRSLPVPRVNLLFGGGEKTVIHLAQDLTKGIPCVLMEDTGGLASLLESPIRLLQASSSPELSSTAHPPIDVADIALPKPELRSFDSKAKRKGKKKTSSKEMQKPDATLDVSTNDNFRKCVRAFENFVLCSCLESQKTEIQSHVLRRHLALPAKEWPPTFPVDLLHLCQSWNCPDVFSDALGIFYKRKNQYINDDVLREVLLSFLKAGSDVYVELLQRMHWDCINVLRKSDFGELYCSNLRMKRVVKGVCKREASTVGGLHRIAEEIFNLLHVEVEPDDDGGGGKTSPTYLDRDFHLFLWSLLYKHYDLARYFWRRCNYPIATGLIASSLLNSASKLESAATLEGNARRKEESDLYEKWASQLLTKCERRSHMRTKFVLLRRLPNRGDMSLLELATKDNENATFLSNDACMHHLDDIWIRCGVKSSWIVSLITPLLVLFLMLALIFFGACFFPVSVTYNFATLGLTVLFLSLFLVGTILLQRFPNHRKPYKSFRPVDDDDEDQDCGKLENMTENEAFLLLRIGIPADLVYKRIQEKKDRVSKGIRFDSIRRRNDASGNCLETLCTTKFSISDYLKFLYLFLDTPHIKFLSAVYMFVFYLFLFGFCVMSAGPDFASTLPTPTEWILIFFWVAFIIHEINQCFEGDVGETESRGFKIKASEYWSSLWNRFDLFLIIYFLVMIGCRIGFYCQLQEPNHSVTPTNATDTTSSTSLAYTITPINLTYAVSPAYITLANRHHSPADVTPSQAHTSNYSVLNLYAFYFTCWCLRILQFFAVSQTMGPMLIMIRLMIRDALKLFLYIMIFTVAYAVWLKVTLRTVEKDFLLTSNSSHPINNATDSPVDYLFSKHLTDVAYFLDDLMKRPFWHLIGENFDNDDNLLPQKNDTQAYAYVYRVSSLLFIEPLMRAIYVVITVVLLLNLMIAVFQYSINEVQGQADRNWNIYRRSVIFQYHNKAFLPSPLSVFSDLFSIACGLYRKFIGRELVSCFSFGPTASERFECSTLRISVNETALLDQDDQDQDDHDHQDEDRDDQDHDEVGQRDVNPFMTWVGFVRNWEKMLQYRHSSVGVVGPISTSGGNAVDQRDTRESASVDALSVVELKGAVASLKMETWKMSGRRNSLFV